MKKFVSMAMVAAMTVSMVPATAFAAGEVTATAKVVDAWDEDKDFTGNITGSDVPELQLKITDARYQNTTNGELPKMDVTVSLDNADLTTQVASDLKALVSVDRKDGGVWSNILDQSATSDTDIITGAVGGGDVIYTEIAGPFATISAAATAGVTGLVKVIGGEDVYFTLDEITGTDAVDADEVVKFLEDEGYELVTLLDANEYYVLYNANGAITDKILATDIVDVPAKTADQVFNEMLLDGYLAVEEEITVAADGSYVDGDEFWAEVKDIDEDEFTVTLHGYFEVDDIVSIDLESYMDKTSERKVATVSVDSKMVTADDLTYVSILGKGIKMSTKKVVDVAEEEVVTLTDKGLVIESAVNEFPVGTKISLKLSNGFEFVKSSINDGVDFNVVDGVGNATTVSYADEDELIVEVKGKTDEIKIYGIDIEATTAKTGAVATIKAKSNNYESSAVEVAKVVDYKVNMSVDKDEDVPVFYSGTDVNNTGLTVDDEHISLEVTIEESFPGAWSMRQGFNLELPDGVYVTDVTVTDTDDLFVGPAEQTPSQVEAKFYDAYQKGDHKGFEFVKRVFDDVKNDLHKDVASMSFELELVADPTFVGDVNLKLTGALIDEQEVTIAKFQPIAVVKAEQNDLKIDYRYTEIPTTITVTETEAGLWKEGSQFWVALEKGEYIEFEDDAKFETTGGLEIDDFTDEYRPNWKGDYVTSLGFEVDGESDEAATVTISDMSLFMQRNIPAGAYDLTAGSTVFGAYQDQVLFAPDCDSIVCDGTCKDKNNDCIIDDVADFSEVVKEAFVNIVTAGREQDDASFTTKVVVPVGESYMVAGETQVSLDVPAYVSAAGYTMLPVRAVATALGINNNNVIWNGESRTVTILYGHRIITMVAGEKAIHVNGSVIPASAAVEIVDGRTFLPMRDLATALGVTDITWDAATKTATLNGNA